MLTKGTMEASSVLRQIVRAKDNMLKKQLGESQAAGASLVATHMLEVLELVDDGCCHMWANFIGEQEKEAHMGNGSRRSKIGVRS